jgi:hypothetical protein
MTLNLNNTPKLTNIGISADPSEEKIPEPNLTSFYNLKRIVVGNSAIASFNFADGGRLEKLEVIGEDVHASNDTISELKLDLSNQNYLERLDYTKMKNLTSLTIKNGTLSTERDGELENGKNLLPSIKEFLMVYYSKDKNWVMNSGNKDTKLKTIEVEGLDWTGNNKIVNRPANYIADEPIASEDYGLLEYLYKLGDVSLSGKVELEYLDSVSKNKYINKWPKLELKINQEIEMHQVTFKNYNDEILL